MALRHPRSWALPVQNEVNIGGADRKIYVVNDTSSSLQIAKEIIIKDPLMVIDRNSSQQIATDVETNKEAELLCNIMGRSEFCEIKGDIRIDRNSSTV
ncbi:hypothetical protein NC653_029076 [Populus alba x Populus x berolinensis]|uniref:Uncharacterized protein n=1 Tax=Populus alba x Populus x berolinensis TaxID=444605 RepID=A0AAD6M188_9ROSI|nr:hypothetical protein NC653_029076 [Populus alba x Populus x berolinensis]